MKKFAACAAALLFAAICPMQKSQAVETPAQITFATLDAHTQIKVDYESQGCYHHYRCKFKFTKNPVLQAAASYLEEVPGITTSSMTLNEMARVHRVWHEKPGGILALTATQAAQLDNLLALYRYNRLYPSKTICTTRDTVTYTFLRGGKTVLAETFEDASDLTSASSYAPAAMQEKAPASEAKISASLTTFGELAYKLNLTPFSGLADKLKTNTKNANGGR